MPERPIGITILAILAGLIGIVAIIGGVIVGAMAGAISDFVKNYIETYYTAMALGFDLVQSLKECWLLLQP